MGILVAIGLWVIASTIMLFFFVGADSADNYDEWNGEDDEQ